MAVVFVNLSTYTQDSTKLCHVKLRCGSAVFTTTAMTWLHEKDVSAHVDHDGRLEPHHLHTRAPLSIQWFHDHEVSEWLVIKNNPVGWSLCHSLLLCVPDIWPEVRQLLETKDMLAEELALPDNFKIPPLPRCRRLTTIGQSAGWLRVLALAGSTTAANTITSAAQVPCLSRTSYTAVTAWLLAVDFCVEQLQQKNRELCASNDELQQLLASFTSHVDAFLNKVNQPPTTLTSLEGTVHTHVVQLLTLQSTINILM